MNTYTCQYEYTILAAKIMVHGLTFRFVYSEDIFQIINLINVEGLFWFVVIKISNSNYIDEG